MKLNVKLPPDCEKIINDFISSKVISSNTDGIVLGLSGGLDSAVVTKLCCKALGNDKVLACLMPEQKDQDENYHDAEELAEDLGVKRIIIEIKPLLDTFIKGLDGLKLTDMAHANLKARIRSVLLYSHANTENRLVAGTSNKSEFMMGYFTKYGDGASDIAPIGDLYKSQVRELARTIDIPDKFITKIPTAGLLPNQTDESELGMSYDILDRILMGLELQYSKETIADILDIPVQQVVDVFELSHRNRHKRKFPKIPKIGIKTIGTDLRE